MGIVDKVKKVLLGNRPPDGPEDVRSAVREAYTSAALDPSGKHAFPVGRKYAESVGYDSETLDALPAAASDSFAGVSNISITADIPPGAVVIDIGCGAGLDALIAARRLKGSGKVIGVDFSAPMLAKAREAAALAGVEIEWHMAGAEELPLPTASADVIIVNGIFNLNPHRHQLFSEMARVSTSIETSI